MAPDKLPLRDLKDYQLEDFLSMPSFPRIVTTSEVQGSSDLQYEAFKHVENRMIRSKGDQKASSPTLQDSSRTIVPFKPRGGGYNDNQGSLELPLGRHSITSIQEYGPSFQADLDSDPRPSHSSVSTKVQTWGVSHSNNPQPPSTSRDTSGNTGSIVSGLSNMRTGRAKRKSKIERELEAHNKSPKTESPPEQKFDFDDGMYAVRKTRNVAKSLKKLAKDEELSPPRTQNVRSLMLEQFNPERERKTYYPEGSAELNSVSPEKRARYNQEFGSLDEEEEDINSEAFATSRYESRSPERQSSLRRFRNKSHTLMLASQFLQDAGRKAAWKDREHQKARINQLLEQLRYDPRPSRREILKAQGVQKPSFYTAKTTQSSRDYSYRLENGTFVFTPTAADFANFTKFLEGMEEIAGRENGVVKIIVPQRCVTGFRSRAQTPVTLSSIEHGDQGLTKPTVRVKLSSWKTSVPKTSPFYGVFITPSPKPSSSSQLLEIINGAKGHLREKYGMAEVIGPSGDVWKHHQARKPYSEARMIRHSAEEDRDIFGVLNESATPELRSALHLGNPNLERYPGNRLLASSSTQPGVNEAAFHVSGEAGLVFPLQLGRFGAYTLNYHHNGAPRRYTVVAPLAHEALEHLLYDEHQLRRSPDQDRSDKRRSVPPPEGDDNQARKPPSCSRFVSHLPMYVPCQTLGIHGIRYTHLTQYEGEMIIIFPYAYYQGFNAGPNITEEMMYGSDRWEIFHREKLYQYCNRNCAEGKADSFDMSFIKNQKGVLSPRGDYRFRRVQELSLTINQQPEDTAEEEPRLQCRHPSTSPRSGSLRAMDRVEDDGAWEETSLDNNVSGGGSTPKNTKSRIIDREKVDIWNVESILGDADDEASPMTVLTRSMKRGRDNVLEEIDGQRPAGPEKRVRKSF